MRTSHRLPVLWLAGAPGAGKSATAWHLFSEAVGSAMAYVDIDQLGMLFPEPEDDPDAERTKALALAATVACYARAGVERLVVSGVIEPGAIGMVRELLAHATELRIVHLRVAEETLMRRLAGRGWPDELVERAVAEQRDLAHAEVDARIDVRAESVADVADAIGPLLGAPGSAVGHVEELPDAEVTGPLEVPITIVTGPRAVGKSTVAWELFQRRAAAGERTGFLDLEQLGFAYVADGLRVRLRVRNVAATADVFRRQGAGEVIVNGSVRGELEMLRELGDVRVIRLTASAADLAERVGRRAVDAGSARLAGDDLLGADPERQEAVVREILAEERWYETSGIGEVVSTSGLAVAEVVDEITAADRAQV